MRCFRRRRLAAAVLGSILLAGAARADYFLRVPVTPFAKDDHTLFLATFDQGSGRADFAKGDPVIRVTGPVQLETGFSGKALRFGEGASIAIAPTGNLLPKAGTIEMVLKDTNDKLRHRLLQIGDGLNVERWFSVQMDVAMWFLGNGANPWIHDKNLRQDFPKEWMYVVLAWDAAARNQTVTIYTLDGRIFMDEQRYTDTSKMKDDLAAQLMEGKVGNILLGSPGIVLDSVRISDIYRKDLADPQRDWGPVEQWANMSGAERMFTEATQLKVWRAGEAKGIADARVTSIQPVIRDDAFKVTDQRKPAVAAWRCSAGDPVFNLDFGTLDIGCYVVRVIAMVKTENIEQFRKPMYIDLKVNDKVGGGETWYRHRIPYWDEFYAVTEIYFNADEKRPYKATLTVGKGSLADLYIHSIEFHDVLKGLPGKAAKKGPSFFTLDERAQLRKNVDPRAIFDKVSINTGAGAMYLKDAPELAGEERVKRDDLLWNALPPLNSQFLAEYDESFFFSKEMRCGDESVEDAAKKYGTWEIAGSYWTRWWETPLVFTNQKLKLTYTREDLAQHKPLPDPYPFKDDGTGVYFPKTDKDHARHFLPLAEILGSWWEACWLPLAPWHGSDLTYRLPYLYHAYDSRNAARDAALLLCRWAWTYPTHTDAQSLGYALVAPATVYNRDLRLRTRALMFYWGSDRGSNLQQGLSRAYDYLFDYIQGNQELARAVGRYIPWVKTDADVRRLIETRILQFGARQSMLFYLINSKSHSVYLLRTAVIQQDPEITRPWMESLWKNTHIYPHPNAGLPHFISTTTQRDGTTDIGSVFYTWGGSPFMETVGLTHQYAKNGGDAKFDLSGPEFGAKMQAACSFPFDSAVAGGYPMTIGDVGGPYKPRMLDILKNFEDNILYGYEWTRAPRFAWLLKNCLGRTDQTDAQWKEIEAAAEKQTRNPFLAQSSRVMANWAGILESGQDSDDFRFKRAAQMRVGFGHGHIHSDTLDLQMLAHGVRVLNDVGWRGEYAYPSSGSSALHNLVEVNETNWQSHSWIAAFAPTPGAQYMEGIAVSPGGPVAGVQRSRSLAMIDVDEGVPGKKAPAPLPYTEKTVFDPQAVTPNSYLFDVQRVSGGKLHTFCFHGTYSDQFDMNVKNASAETPKDEETYLRRWLKGDGMRILGRSQDPAVATWRLRRTEGTLTGVARDGKVVSVPQINAEKYMLGVNYDEKAPAKFTRLYLFGHPDEAVMVAHFQPFEERVKETWPFLMVQRKGDALQSVYPSLIEPYARDPFIAEARAIEIPQGEKDSLQAVAVQVKTKNGRTDLCFSDGRPDMTRQVADVKVSGRFAYLSRDEKGLRLAQLVAGTELSTPFGALTLETPELKAKIARVDYWKRTIWLDQIWPAGELAGEQVELGNPDHRTSFTVVSARVENDRTVLVMDKAIDLSYAAVTGVQPQVSRVGVNVAFVGADFPGIKDGLTCTNEAMDKSWRCRFVGDDPRLKQVYQLAGAFTENDFPVGSLFRVWEFGVGDDARLACRAAVRRNADGKLVVETNARARWTPR